MSTTQQTDEQAATYDTAGPTVTRRTMMQSTAAAVTAAAMAGVVGAAPLSDDLNFDSGMVPNPSVEVDATVADHDPEMSVLEYYNDAGEVESLADYGAKVRPRADNDPDVDETPHNPITLRADKIGLESYYKYPRGETYDESGDGDEDTDLDVLDATHWTTDESGTAGSISVADSESPAGAKGLNFSTSSQTSGDTALATFSDGELTDGIDRTYIQVGFTGNSIDSGVTVEVRVIDSNDNSRAVQIKDGGDTSTTQVIGTGTETAAVRQVELGNLSGTLNDIQKVQVAVLDGNADLDVFALNAERSTRWSFGTREYEGTDDDGNTVLKTETVYEPTDTFSVVSYDSLPDGVKASQIADLGVDVEFYGKMLGDGWASYTFEDAGRYDQDYKFRLVQNFEFPGSFALDLVVNDVMGEQNHPSNRYLGVEVENGDQDPYTVSNVDDDSDGIDGSDITGKYDGGIGDSVTITQGAQQGQTTSFYTQILVNEDERNEMEMADESAQGGGGAFGGGREGDGVLSSIISAPGAIIGAVIAFVGARASGLLGGN